MTTAVPAGGSLLDSVMSKIAAARNSAEAIIDRAERERRNLTESECDEFDRQLAHLKGLTDHRDQLLAQRSREDAAARARRESGQTNMTYSPGRVLAEPSTYRKNDPSSPSWFRDLFEARNTGDRAAAERLLRNDRESRALSNDAGAGGAGGEFAPPAWLLDDYAALARPARPTADLLNSRPLPSGQSTLHVPKVTTGSLTGVQDTQNTALAQQDLATTSVSSGISTIGGKMIVSQQLLDQSGLNLDDVIMADLSADLAARLDAQVLTGTGTSGELAGILGVSGLNSVTYTDASPAVAGAGKLYAVMAKAKQAVDTTRFAPITAWVMHPRRWAWITASFDLQDRPLFVSEAYHPQNGAGVVDRVAAQAVVGSMHSLPVIIDAQCPTDLGAGSDEDVIIGAKWDDLYLYEGTPRLEAFAATYADQLSVLVRCYNYFGLIPHRQPKAIVTITGTGLKDPAY